MDVIRKLEFIDKGREFDAKALRLVDDNGTAISETNKIVITGHNDILTDFSINVFPHNFNRLLIPTYLRRVADKIEYEQMSMTIDSMNVNEGEIVEIPDGPKLIVVGNIPGMQHPAVVVDITDYKSFDAPLTMASAGPVKYGMWEACMKSNAQHIKHGVKELFGTKKGKRCIIAGSGPSLQVERLKKGVPGWDIIACNDAYRLLDGNADYAFFMESEANPKWWSKIQRKTKLINCVYSHPDIAKQAWTRTYWFGTFPLRAALPSNDEIVKKAGALYEQMNCTASALYFAYLAGYSEIIFVGCDFAYTAGESHKGEPHSRRGFLYAMAEDVNGGQVLTDRMLAIQARCHEAMAYWLIKEGRKVYNCTEGGIMAAGNTEPSSMLCKKLEDMIGEQI